jgi:hypothetical protein
MFNDIRSTHSWKLLLSQGFESYVFCMLRITLWGKNQTMLIDDELSKVLQNFKSNGLFWESFKRHKLSKNKVQWLDLTS